MDNILIQSLHNYYCKNLQSDMKYLQTRGIRLVQTQKSCIKFTKSSHGALLAFDELVYKL